MRLSPNALLPALGLMLGLLAASPARAGLAVCLANRSGQPITVTNRLHATSSRNAEVEAVVLVDQAGAARPAPVSLLPLMDASAVGMVLQPGERVVLTAVGAPLEEHRSVLEIQAAGAPGAVFLQYAVGVKDGEWEGELNYDPQALPPTLPKPRLDRIDYDALAFLGYEAPAAGGEAKQQEAAPARAVPIAPCKVQ